MKREVFDWARDTELSREPVDPGLVVIAVSVFLHALLALVAAMGV